MDAIYVSLDVDERDFHYCQPLHFPDKSKLTILLRVKRSSRCAVSMRQSVSKGRMWQVVDNRAAVIGKAVSNARERLQTE